MSTKAAVVRDLLQMSLGAQCTVPAKVIAEKTVFMTDYNQRSLVQRGWGLDGLGELRAAAAAILSSAGDRIRVADFGSAEGANSSIFLDAFVAAVRELEGGARIQIEVSHMDTPGNNWEELFRAVDATPGSYTRHAGTFVSAHAGTFYKQCFPSRSLDLVFSSTAFHWPSDSTLKKPDDATAAQLAAEDWLAILTHRAAELRTGGRMVVVHIGELRCMWCSADSFRVWHSLYADGHINQEERDALKVALCPRDREALLAPLQGPLGERLKVVSARTVFHPCPMYAQYEKDGDKAALVSGLIEFMSGVMSSSIHAAVARRPIEERKRLAALAFERLRNEWLQRDLKSGIDAVLEILSLESL